jgi:hypothetical protein
VTSWAVLLGALGATATAWAAIASIAFVDESQLDPEPVRLCGALALAVVALRVAGLAVPWLVAPGLLLAGLGWGFARPRLT